MSIGKPVVATNIPESGVSWVNAHGVSGLNVPPEDPKALAEALVKVLDEKEAFGARAKARYEEISPSRRCPRLPRVLPGLL